jgi:hypothetical protein
MRGRRLTLRLADIIRQKDIGDDVTIYAERPWTTSSEAILVSPPPEFIDAIRQGERAFDYFLEAFIARDFLGDLMALGDGAAMSDYEQCERLIQYAESDA